MITQATPTHPSPATTRFPRGGCCKKKIDSLKLVLLFFLVNPTYPTYPTNPKQLHGHKHKQIIHTIIRVDGLGWLDWLDPNATRSYTLG